jgi:hypothetical protein
MSSFTNIASFLLIDADPALMVACVKTCFPNATSPNTNENSPYKSNNATGNSNHAFNIPSIYSLLVYSIAMLLIGVVADLLT